MANWYKQIFYQEKEENRFLLPLTQRHFKLFSVTSWEAFRQLTLTPNNSPKRIRKSIKSLEMKRFPWRPTLLFFAGLRQGHSVFSDQQERSSPIIFKKRSWSVGLPFWPRSKRFASHDTRSSFLPHPKPPASGFIEYLFSSTETGRHRGDNQFLSALCASVFFFPVLPPNASTLVSEYLDKWRDIQEVDNSVLINIRFG